MGFRGAKVTRQAGEPSVEEILESIKKVIARDNRAEAEQLRKRREEDGVMISRAILPEEMTEDGAAEDDDVLELTDALEPLMMSGASEQLRGDDDPLLAADRRASMRESLTALAMLSEPGAAPQIVRSGETSLEQLTRDLLRPMLAQWLDKNLPPLVEKLVAAEIQRIAGKRG